MKHFSSSVFSNKATHYFSGEVKYCNPLTSPRCRIKFKGSTIHSSPLPKMFPSLTPCIMVTGWVTSLGRLVATGRRRGAGSFGSSCQSLPSCPMLGMAMAFRGKARALNGVSQPQMAQGCREKSHFTQHRDVQEERNHPLARPLQAGKVLISFMSLMSYHISDAVTTPSWDIFSGNTYREVRTVLLKNKYP